MQERDYSDTYDRSTATLAVSGAVTEGSVDRLERAVSEHSQDLTHDLVVDLTDVDFLPSAAIGVLAVAIRGAGRHGATVELRSRPESVTYRVLQICGLPFSTVA